ncbi:uncharacterized protein GIQ15_02435 [Arthroderma uncinatum]|uniref:uncharacterized protein n=1 Tax=Arthroderma uncinatum TaxID=74035 RepID=UPI00144A7955|nr:uncharacterized protein GIQ15_02435 [Arthroderma uncinatum]KAF3483111.1 hypothetical protein GIQ15_02435 [Arthroderma uncinatum]
MPPKKYLNWQPFALGILETRALDTLQDLPPARHCTVGHPARLRESGVHAAAFFYLVTAADPGPWYVIDGVLWDTDSNSKLYEGTFIVPYRDPPSRRHRFCAEWNEGLGVFIVRNEVTGKENKPPRSRGAASMISYDGSSDGLEEAWGSRTVDEAHLVGDTLDTKCLPPLPGDYLEDASQCESEGASSSSSGNGDVLADSGSGHSLDPVDMSTTLYTAIDKQSNPLTIQTLLLGQAPASEIEAIPAEPNDQTSIALQKDLHALTDEVDTIDVQHFPESHDANTPAGHAIDELSHDLDDTTAITHQLEDPATEAADTSFPEFVDQQSTQEEDDEAGAGAGADDWETNSNPSDREISDIAHDELRWRDYLTEYYPQIHHFNFFGDAIVYRSCTPPEVSLFALMCGPKPWHYDVSSRAVAVRQALKFVDPVLYTGSLRDISSYSGHRLIKAITGNVHQFYTEHGCWVHDIVKWAQERPILDPTDSESYYSETWLPVNGWLKVHWRVPSRYEYLAGAGTSKPERKVRLARMPKSPLSKSMSASEC